MSLESILFKLGLAQSPLHAAEKLAALGKVAENPAASGLGSLAEQLEIKAFGKRPRVNVRTEFHDSPRPLTPELDNAATDAMNGRAGYGRGLGGEDVEFMDIGGGADSNLWGKEADLAGSEKLDALARFLRRQERTARAHPLAYNLGAGGAAAGAGGGLLALLSGDDE